MWLTDVILVSYYISCWYCSSNALKVTNHILVDACGRQNLTTCILSKGKLICRWRFCVECSYCVLKVHADIWEGCTASIWYPCETYSGSVFIWNVRTMLYCALWKPQNRHHLNHNTCSENQRTHVRSMFYYILLILMYLMD